MPTSIKISIRLALCCLLALAPILAYGNGAMFFGANASSSAAFTPASVAGIQYWYEANAGVTCTGGCTNGAVVTAWADQSTNANNATCSSGPTYVSSAVNAKPGIAFLGSSSQSCSPGSSIAWSGSQSIFVVFKITSVGALSPFVGGANTAHLLYDIGTAGNQQLVVTTVAGLGLGSATITGGTFYQANATYNSSSGVFAFRIGEASDGGGTSAQTVSGAQTLIAAETSSPFLLTGTIVEIFSYSNVVSGPNITALETYLNGKYGI